jgi:hypothetical protein
MKTLNRTPLRAKITEALLYTWGTFPYLFSSKLRFIGENRNTDGWMETDIEVETSGLFDETCHWKGLAVVTPLSAQELRCIGDWMRSMGFRANYEHARDKILFEQYYTQYDSFRDIGVININSEKSLQAIISIQSEKETSNWCYLSLFKGRKGNCFISLYFLFNETTQKSLSSIDVRNTGHYRQLTTLNPFHRDFGAITYHDRYNNIEDETTNETKRIILDTQAIAIDTLRALRIKKTSDDFTTIADIYRDTPSPYFNKNTPSSPNEELKRHTCIPPRMHFYNTEISDNECENYIEEGRAKEVGLDGIHIYSEEPALDPHRDHRKYGRSIHDSHLIIALLSHLAKKISKIEHKSGSTIFTNPEKNEKSYENLLKCIVTLDELENKIKSLKIFTDRHHPNLREFFEHASNHQTRRASLLKKSIENKKTQTNEKIQHKNLIFQRRNTWLILLLALIQVACAIIQIQQSKQEEFKFQRAVSFSTETTIKKPAS